MSESGHDHRRRDHRDHDGAPASPGIDPAGAALRFTTTALVGSAVMAGRLPVVGPSLAPLGAVTALGVWGARHAPNLAASALSSALRPGAGDARRRAVLATANAYARAFGDPPLPPVPATRPLRSAARRRLLDRGDLVLVEDVAYGPSPAHRLDVWRRRDLPEDARSPVLLYVPGGGWVHGSRRFQGYGLLRRLAEAGWTCVSIDYRVAPRHRWPAHIRDVLRAVAWTRAHIAEWGGDPASLTLAGASAGGHLAALAALGTDPAHRPGGLPAGADTSVDAVVGLYGRYDWMDRATVERARFVEFLECVVVGRPQAGAGDLYRSASPIALVGPHAPPFLVVHGDSDTVIPVEQARAFVSALRAVSRSPVVYAELPGAPHAFDLLGDGRTEQTARAVDRFVRAVAPAGDQVRVKA